MQFASGITFYLELSVKFFILLFLCAALPACVKLALRSSPSFIPQLSQAFFEECDPDLSKQSLPSSLKIMEGLLKNDPENRQILTALCTGFTGYALLFVEENDPDRASLLYLRARDYGFTALGKKAPFSRKSKLTKKTVRDRLGAIKKDDLEVLFWSTMAWNSWINLNLEKPAALGQLSAAQACLKRILEINPDYYYGTPYILMGSTLSALPGSFGGDEKQAKEFFEKALKTSDGKFLLAQYYFARYYAVRVQDKGLFTELINRILDASPDELKDACLVNSVMKEKSKRLLELSDELFL
jgi:tetratricopeptide (TPR) repeat protein